MIGIAIWIGGAAMVIWEPIAAATGRRTVSHFRGPLYVALVAWMIALAVHTTVEHLMDTIAEEATLV